MACPILTEDQLEYAAEHIRKSLGYGPTECIHGSEFLARYVQQMNPSLQFNVVPDKELPFAEAEAYPAQNMIRVRKSTYDHFMTGDARSKMIVVEEVCHIMRKHEGAMHRTVGNDNFARANPHKGAQEREAKYLAAAIIAPQQAAVALDNFEAISQHFGMSAQSAKIRFEQTGKIRRKTAGQPRLFSAQTIEKVRKLEEITGYRITNVKEH
jgi:hypothetical protein